MNSSAHNPLWELIDGAVVINLDHRTDRWAQFQQATCNIVPAEKLQRLAARLGRDIPGFGERPWFRGGKRDAVWAARAGCTISHRNALAHARALGWQTVLIFEDDAMFTPEWADVIAPLGAALQDCDWEVCYLGFTDAWWPRRKLASLGSRHALYQIHGCTTGHAYVVRARARDWMLAQMPEEANLWPWVARHRISDRWFQRYLGLHFPVVCVSPELVVQTGGFSDITKQTHQERMADGLTRTVAAWSTSDASYYFGHAARRLSVGAGLVGDAIRGWARRFTGF
jgi:glycosyl transferase family 25